MGKLIISFSPGDDAWVNKAFRDLMKDVSLDTDEIKLYIITTDTDTVFVNQVAGYFDLDTSLDVFQVANQAAALVKIQSLGVMIHMDADVVLCNYVNDTDPIVLETPIDGCQAIVVSNLLDRYKLQPLYVTHLQFWMDKISKFIPGGEEKEC
jgi:hypothetical protein